MVGKFTATFTQTDKGMVETAKGAIQYGDGFIYNAKISTKTSTGGITTVDSGVSDKADVSVGSK